MSADEVREVSYDRWLGAATELKAELGECVATMLSAAPARADGLLVVVRLWSLTRRRGVRLQTLAPGSLPSLTPLWPGLGWWEREAAETWGLTFDGHPDLRPLLGATRARLGRRDEPWPGSFDPLGRRAPKPLGSPHV